MHETDIRRPEPERSSVETGPNIDDSGKDERNTERGSFNDEGA